MAQRQMPVFVAELQEGLCEKNLTLNAEDEGGNVGTKLFEVMFTARQLFVNLAIFTFKKFEKEGLFPALSIADIGDRIHSKCRAQV
jgi:hypothetical protein